MAKEQEPYTFAAAYIRVSTEDQVDLSPESQLVEIRKYAERENITLLEDYIYIDAGISGKSAGNRPAFQEMIAQAKEKSCPFSVILLWKFSRFARNQEESIFYKSLLRSKCNVEVLSISEPLASGPYGSLIERIIEWMDEFYSIRLSQEVKRSMTVNAKNGVLQATPAFGYRAVNGKLVPVEDEAKYVRYIFDAFISGEKLVTIARNLNAQNVTTHRGNPMENRAIEYILRNPVYIGKLRWNPSGRSDRDFSNENIIFADGCHEPLISMETWEAAQKRMDHQKLVYRYKARPSSELKGWLSGVVRCAACHATLIHCNGDHYRCGDYSKGRCVHSQYVFASVLEDAIISKLEVDSKNVDSIAYKMCATGNSIAQDVARLESSLRSLKSKEARLQDAYLAEVIDLNAFASAKAGIDAEVQRINEEIELANSKLNVEVVGGRLEGILSSVVDILKSPDESVAAKNEALRSVIETCYFDRDAALLTITYRLEM